MNNETTSADRAIVALVQDAWEARLECPNDDITRGWLITHLTRLLEPMMVASRIRRYQITCDDTNNPPLVLDSGGLGLRVDWLHVQARNGLYHYIDSRHPETLHLFKPRPVR